MNYQNMKTKSDYGDLFIRYENHFSSLKYQLYEGTNHTPYKIDLKFIPNKNTTKIIWYITTPRTSFLGRAYNLISEDYIASTIDKSMINLSQVLGGKVDKEILLSNIKYDTLMVEKQNGFLLLGVNVSSVNKKGELIKNIELNHGKVYNFVTKDLGKKEDEFGAPVLITDARAYKNKEVSYYYGIPLSKRVGVSDNNFSFRTVGSTDSYVMYYQGKYDGRIKAINQLLDKAKKDSMRNGELQEMFIEAPNSRADVKIKLTLPVFR
jgi:effector-binding domain-containing protein